ncbi:hypothetical protein [Arvimicrobium flavum]|uniref:hypothetical protein n=1 Tax=Arvimicrobium flavum TaxID=3393320 RepID=UPI00237BA04E|nr:hypothetical protein [Mesorhizobium shangrilense]
MPHTPEPSEIRQEIQSGPAPLVDSLGDRIQAALDAALEKVSGLDSSDDHFSVVAYAAANRISSRYQGTTLPGALREPLSASLSWIGENLMGRGPTVSIQQDGDEDRPVDIEFVVSGHRVDRIGNRSYVIPVDPLRLALAGAGLRTRALYYSMPEGQTAPDTGNIVRHRWSVLDRGCCASRASRASCASIISEAIRSVGLRVPVLLPTWLDGLVTLTEAVRQALGARWGKRRPGGVIVSGGVDPFTSGAVLAARDFGIPSFELQHGHLRSFDPRCCGSAGGAGVADHFLAWTSASPLADNASTIVVGAPLRLMESALAERAAPGLAAAIDEERRSIAGRLSSLDERVGLVSRQPGVDVEAAALEAANLVGISQLLWRNHPRQKVRRDDALDRFTSKAPLGLLLERVAVHFTHSSAAALEAHDVGVATQFLSNRGRGLMRDAEPPGRTDAHAVTAAVARIADIVGRPGALAA